MSIEWKEAFYLVICHDRVSLPGLGVQAFAQWLRMAMKTNLSAALGVTGRTQCAHERHTCKRHFGSSL